MDVNAHLTAVPDSGSGLPVGELRGWGYTKAADFAALPTTGIQVGEIRTLSDSGWNARWDGREWIPWAPQIAEYPAPNPTFTISSGAALPVPTRAGDTLWRQAGAGTTDEFYQAVTTTLGGLSWQASSTLPAAPAPSFKIPTNPTYQQWLALQATNLWVASDLPGGTVGAWRDRIGGATAVSGGSPVKYAAGETYSDFTAATRTADKDLVYLDGAGQYFTIDGVEPNLSTSATTSFVAEVTLWGTGRIGFGRLYTCNDGAGLVNDNGIHLTGDAAPTWTQMWLRVGDGAAHTIATGISPTFDAPQVMGWTVSPTTATAIAGSALSSSVARSGNDETPAAGTPTVIGAFSGLTSGFLAGAISWMALFDRELSNADIAALQVGVPTL